LIDVVDVNTVSGNPTAEFGRIFGLVGTTDEGVGVGADGLDRFESSPSQLFSQPKTPPFRLDDGSV
jgi:hypothetical protein